MTNPQHTFRVAKFVGTSVANYSAICAAIGKITKPTILVVVSDVLALLPASDVANESDSVDLYCLR